MRDTINRQDAIDYVDCGHLRPPTELAWSDLDVVNMLKQLPSAEKRTNEHTKTHECDLISRQDAIMHFVKASKNYECGMFDLKELTHELWQLPSAEPEIIRCKDCVKHNKAHGFYNDGTFVGIRDCCPLVEIRGMAQGHEFDYQYCAYAERKTDDE